MPDERERWMEESGREEEGEKEKKGGSAPLRPQRVERRT
jgi:hypothetical protein